MEWRETYTYKTVEDCNIHADVYHWERNSAQPILVWIHGGGLIQGQRDAIPDFQVQQYLDAGLTVVSIDYRLAPETKLKGIVEDIQDAYRWVRTELPKRAKVDPERIAVMGQSAGGYLTLMMGFCVSPRPRALIPFYGYGDILGTWYSKPDPFYIRQPLVSKLEAYAAITVGMVSNSSRLSNRDRLYLYCRQQGVWPQLVADFNPDLPAGTLASFRPIKNVSPEYPPTLLLHGDADTDVPYEESVAMSRELARYGIEHDLVTLKGKGHIFDIEIADPQVKFAFCRVLEFLQKHLLAETSSSAHIAGTVSVIEN